MSVQLIQECTNFATYIANADASTWNGLCRKLSSLYKEQQENSQVFDFLAFDACHRISENSFPKYSYAFCALELQRLFRQHRRAVIALTAQEIMFRIKSELEIGNYYD